MRLLLVEHHRPLLRAFVQHLEEEGFDLDVAFDGGDADCKVAASDYDVIVLDLKLPLNDGLSLIQKWRAMKVQAHIVILTGEDSINNQVKGLEFGANDYLVKPFEFEQLLTLIRPMNNRPVPRERENSFASSVSEPSRNELVFKIQDLLIDTSLRSVRRGGKTLRLTPREYSLLEFLARHQGKVVTRTMIWRHLYREQDEKLSNVIDVYIRYLRNKVDKGFNEPLIRTRWGIGYMLGPVDSEVLVTS